MKILHSADWHLDSPFQGRSPEQALLLRRALLTVPYQVVAAARSEQCDLIVLSGDLFDGPCSPESLRALQTALEEAEIPVVIAPGNHDYAGPNSPWLTERWPGNVRIFTKPEIECVDFPELDCRVYGAAFSGTDAPALLEGFFADGPQRYHLGVLHGDPTQASSPYNPVTAEQIQRSQLDYLALGHIHKGGSIQCGKTLCAWPGCPMGRGFDELDTKGVLIVRLDEGCNTTFLPLDVPRFYWLEAEVETDAAAAIARCLPAAAGTDFFRITLTGESEPVDTDALVAQFAQFPNLELRDRTVPPIDLWASVGDDSLEGVYFRLLMEAMEGQDEETCRRISLAAKISRKILSGQEVKLP